MSTQTMMDATQKSIDAARKAALAKQVAQQQGLGKSTGYAQPTGGTTGGKTTNPVIPGSPGSGINIGPTTGPTNIYKPTIPSVINNPPVMYKPQLPTRVIAPTVPSFQLQPNIPIQVKRAQSGIPQYAPVQTVKIAGPEIPKLAPSIPKVAVNPIEPKEVKAPSYSVNLEPDPVVPVVKTPDKPVVKSAPPLNIQINKEAFSGKADTSNAPGTTETTKNLFAEANKTPASIAPITPPSGTPGFKDFNQNTIGLQNIANAPTNKLGPLSNPGKVEQVKPTGAPEFSNFKGNNTAMMKALENKVILPGTREWDTLQQAKAGATTGDIAAQTAQNKSLQQLSGQSASGAALPDQYSQTAAPAKSQYDLIRERIQGEEARNQQAQQEQIKQNLASKGLGAGTGFGEKALQKAQLEQQRIQAGRLGEVDVAQAAAQEQRDEAERTRTFQSGQAEMDRQLSRDVEQGRLTMQEKDMALQATQFTSKQEFDTWSTQQGFTAQERDNAWNAAQATQEQQVKRDEANVDRQLTLQVEQGKISQQDKQMAMDAAKFTSQQQYDTWATQQGLTAQERQNAWDAAKQTSTQQFEQTERQATQAFDTALTSMKNDFETGRMNLEDQIADKNKLDVALSDAAFKLGAMGTATQVEIDKMSDLEKASYLAGQSGMGYEQYSQDREDRVAYRNALITRLDPDDPTFVTQVNSIWQMNPPAPPTPAVDDGTPGKTYIQPPVRSPNTRSR